MWDDIIQDTVFIGQSAEDLNQEIETNTWLISMSNIERASTAPETLMRFFEAVMDNRRAQIRHAQASHGMWFYVWHDQQAAQLRFSLISDVHQRLPFGGETIFAELASLVEEFLRSPAAMPWPAFDTFDISLNEYSPEYNVPPYVMPVFCVQLL